MLNLDHVRAVLERHGFDIVSRETTARGGSLTARREGIGQTVVLSLDAGGRVRATITRQYGEWGPLPIERVGLELRLTGEHTATTVVVGYARTTGAVGELVRLLDDDREAEQFGPRPS